MMIMKGYRKEHTNAILVVSLSFIYLSTEVKDELIGQAAYELWCKRSFFDNRKAAQKRNGEGR